MVRHFALRPVARVILREPLAHFLVVGLVLYLAGAAYQRQQDLYRIEVTPARVAYLMETYRKQYGDAPDARMREIIIQSDIDNEILYREGLRLKLNQQDEIVRRRVIQKMQFLAENVNAPSEPSEAEIAAYYRENSALYEQPISVTFTHVYFSDDQSVAPALPRAQDALAQLRKSNASRAPDLGDRFPDLYDFAGYGTAQVERLFGRSPFSKAALEVPLGQWNGPLRSGYGWHLVKVTARSAATMAPLAQVRDKVRSDLLASAQEKRNQESFQTLRRRFTIVRSETVP
jgi:peptidyl-prolyl cis-trans isomerase C